jgi:hypothetical protein
MNIKNNEGNYISFNDIIILEPVRETWVVKCQTPRVDEVIKYIRSYNGIIKNTRVSNHGITSIIIEMYQNLACDLEMWNAIFDVKKLDKQNQ